MASARGHETIDHTADMGVRGWGGTPAEAFEEAAAAMLELMVDARGLPPSRRVSVSSRGVDLAELLLEFLNALIAQADVAGMVFFKAEVEALEKRNGAWALDAIAEGAPVADVRERLLVEVKAATYYGASVRRDEGGTWVAQCVVDL